jgi:outer membrane lipoprotein LolB
MPPYRLLAAALLALLLSACAVVPPAPVVDVEYAERAAALRALPAWALSGRAAIRAGDESGTVSLSWRQVGERYRVDMRAPWGAGSVRVEGGPGAVMLRTADGTEAFAEDASELLLHYTGYDLPLGALRYWLLGIPDPDPAAEASYALDPQGLVSELRQHGWRVEYRRYGDYDGRALPNTLFMRAEGMEVRVAVMQWEVDP